MSVSIHSLNQAAHLNGTSGVLRSFDTQAGRWRVEIPGSCPEIAVKAENIKPLARSSSASRGPATREPNYKAMSGRQNLSRSMDWAEMRQSPSRTSANTPPKLEPGCKVRLEGLMGAAHLNGLFGSLHHFDHQTLRWHVELPSGEKKAVRPENLDVLGLRASGSPTPLAPLGSQRLNNQSSGQSLPEVAGYTNGRR